MKLCQFFLQVVRESWVVVLSDQKNFNAIPFGRYEYASIGANPRKPPPNPISC